MSNDNITQSDPENIKNVIDVELDTYRSELRTRPGCFNQFITHFPYFSSLDEQMHFYRFSEAVIPVNYLVKESMIKELEITYKVEPDYFSDSKICNLFAYDLLGRLLGKSDVTKSKMHSLESLLYQLDLMENTYKIGLFNWTRAPDMKLSNFHLKTDFTFVKDEIYYYISNFNGSLYFMKFINSELHFYHTSSDSIFSGIHYAKYVSCYIMGMNIFDKVGNVSVHFYFNGNKLNNIFDYESGDAVIYCVLNRIKFPICLPGKLREYSIFKLLKKDIEAFKIAPLEKVTFIVKLPENLADDSYMERLLKIISSIEADQFDEFKKKIGFSEYINNGKQFPHMYIVDLAPN